MVRQLLPVSQRKGERRRISPLELFIDLVFVGVISVVAEDIDPSSNTEVLIVVLMAGGAGFLIWFSTTLIFNLFPAEHPPADSREAAWRVIRLLLVFIEMVALLIAALAVQPFGGLSYRDGFWAFAVAQLSILFLYVVGERVGSYSPRYSRLTEALLVFAALTALLSAILPYDLRILFSLGVLSLGAQLCVAMSLAIPGDSQLRMWHLSERFGLLLLICIGEVFITLTFSLRTASSIPYPLMFGAALLFPLAMFVLAFGVAAPIRTRFPPLWIWAILQCILVMETISAGHQLAAIAAEPGLAKLPWACSGTAIRLAEVLIVVAILCFLGRRVPTGVPLTYFVGAAAVLAVGFSPAPVDAEGVRLALQSGIFMLVAIIGVVITVRNRDKDWRSDWYEELDEEVDEN